MQQSDGENQQSLPPYTYVPGVTPHPESDPRGHSHGVDSHPPGGLAWGRTLFDHGYYWEAHEAWEVAWHAAGRKGPEADFLKALIKLAAAGVKCLEGRPEGIKRHLSRAAELFRNCQAEGTSQAVELVAFAERLQRNSPKCSEEMRKKAKDGGVPVLGSLPEHLPPGIEHQRHE